MYEFQENLKAVSILGLINVGITLFDAAQGVDSGGTRLDGDNQNRAQRKLRLVEEALLSRGLDVDFALINRTILEGQPFVLINAEDAIEKGYAHLRDF